MSDTRAAIRELRSLSEKRSLSALTEAEAARWMTLRRQLGLPLEPVTASESSPRPDAAGEPVTLAPGPDLVPRSDLGTPSEPDEAAPTALAWESDEGTSASEAASPDAPPPADAHWAGPSLDSPAAPATSAWVGPAIDAPAWSDAAADRPTDPGLDEPPPAPFDEAPAAARPTQQGEPTEFGGSPADKVPLAVAADFVSYGRQGNEAIDLPPDSGTAADFEQESLAQLSHTHELVQGSEHVLHEAPAPLEPEPTSPEARHESAPREAPREMEPLPYGALGTAPSVMPDPPREMEPLPYDALGSADAGFPEPSRKVEAPPSEAFHADEGVLPEPPQTLDAAAPDAFPTDEGVLPEPPHALDAAAPDAFPTDEGVLPEPPHALDAAAPDAFPTDEGVLPEPPHALDAAAPEAFLTNEGVLPEPPHALDAAAPEAFPADEGVLPEPPYALDAAAPEAVSADEGVLPEPVSEREPSPFEALLTDGDLPEPPRAPDASPFEASPSDEGVLPEPPFALESPSAQAGGMYASALPEARQEVEASDPEAVPTEEHVFPGTPPPLQLGTPLSHVSSETWDGMHSGLAGPPEPPPLAATWAPGSAEPPLLAADDFGRTGDPLGGRGLDPWPDGLSAAPLADDAVETVSAAPLADDAVETVSAAPLADDAVETVGDDDLVEDIPPSAPEAPSPVAIPPGSGGIRGFQFPKPPRGGFPTPVPWQRTEPGVPPFAAGAAAPTAAPLANHAAPTPTRYPERASPAPVPPAAVVVPVPPTPPSRSVTPTAVAPQTPLPTTQPRRPSPPAASTPVTPPPTSRPAIPLSRPVTETEVPTFPGAEAVRMRPSSSVPRTPVPMLARPAPSLRPAVDAEETAAQPVLELVDEVEPAQRAAPRRSEPTPSPATGTPAVFGPPMMLNPSIVEGDHRVVVHTLEGQVHRGTVHDLDLQEDALAVQQSDGRSVQIPTKRVKAVFFVLAPGGKPLPSRGERVQVTFQDGRQVVGYSDDHATGEPGFFVVPSDARTNTARVYVFRGSVQSITTG